MTFCWRGCHDSGEMPGPPACCEKSPCAILCGHVPGLAWVDERRDSLTKTLLALHAVAVFLGVWAACGAQRGSDLRTTYWSFVRVHPKHHAQYDVGKLYFGFNGVYSDGGYLGTKYYDWDAFTDAVQTENEDEMQSCADASSTMFVSSVIACLTLLPSINTLNLRRTAATDSACSKFSSVFPSIAGSVATLVSVTSFSEDCFRAFPSKIRDQDGATVAELEKKYGFGWYFEIVVSAIGITTGVVMLGLSSPPRATSADPEVGNAIKIEPPPAPSSKPPAKKKAPSKARVHRPKKAAVDMISVKMDPDEAALDVPPAGILAVLDERQKPAGSCAADCSC